MNTDSIKDIIGSHVTVTVDRPLGSIHPKHSDLVYPVNYGYVHGIMGGDGEWQDAYVLGVDSKIDTFDGVVIAVIVRADDNETKWVVVPQGVQVTKDEIVHATHFQERYFTSTVIM